MNEIMILGTFHMSAKNDRVNFNGTETITEHEEAIVQLVDNIAKFNPTYIAVEHSKSKQDDLDNSYREYISDGATSPDEVEQIAFRLAKQLGLKKVNAVDWMEMGAVQHGFGEVYEYVHTMQPELAKEIDALEGLPVDLEKETIMETYVRLNSPESVENTLAYYMNYARVGGDDYYGNGWLIWWYQRNLNIYKNITSLVEGEEDERILLIIGSAHKGILEQFANNSKFLEVVDVLTYLER